MICAHDLTVVGTYGDGSCKPCKREGSRRYSASGRGKAMRLARVPRARARERVLTMVRDRGVTPEQFTAMLDRQGGVCAICRRPERRPRRMAIDHDHDTGQNRGLLCDKCNTGLGLFRDDLGLIEAARLYLQAWFPA